MGAGHERFVLAGRLIQTGAARRSESEKKPGLIRDAFDPLSGFFGEILPVSIKISLAWMGAAQAASFIAQFGCSVVLARYLSPHEMGIFAIAMATVGMLTLLQSFGLHPLIVREEVLDESVAITAFTINALISIAACAATILCAYLGGKLLGDDGVRRVLLVLSISPLFGILGFLPGSQMERNARFKELALITMATAFVGAITTIVLTLLGFRYMSLAYSTVVSSAFLACTITIVGRRYLSCRVGLHAWRRVLRFSGHVLVITTVTNFSPRLCEVLLGRILGLAPLGLYNRASGFNNILWTNIHSLVSRVVLVDFAGLHRTATSLRQRYIQTMALTTGFLWPAFGGIALLSKPFIVMLFGRPWVAAAVPLTLLAVASMILVATSMAWEMCTATGNIHIATRVETIRAACSLPLFVAGCLISLEAVAFSRLVDAILAFLLYRRHLNQMSGTRFQDFAEIYGQGAVLTAAALAPSALLLLFSQNWEPRVTLLVGTVVAGIALWGVMLFVLTHPLSRELIATLHKRLPGFTRPQR